MSYQRRIDVVITANSGNAEAAYNRHVAGLTRLEAGLGRSQQKMSLWDQQMRAIGTTMRYAFAGSIVFSVAQGVAALSTFERKMGDVAALAVNTNLAGGLGQTITDMKQLSQSALQISNDLASPVDQIQVLMETFYSSFEVPAGNEGVKQVQQFSDTVGKLGRVGQTTDLTKLAEGVIGFSNALEGGRAGVPRTSRELARTIQRSVGFRGDVLAQNVGRLGGAALQGGFTGPEILGLLTTASRGGGSAAVIARGITQLGTNILDPNTDEVKKAYREANIPTDPQQLAQLGGREVLRRMMEAVQQRGGLTVSRGAARIGDSAALQQEAAGGVPTGIAGGGTDLANRFFGRAESLRQFALIMSQGAPVLDDFIKQIGDAGNTTGKTNDVLEKMFEATRPFSELSQAGNAVKNLRLAAIQSLDPVLHPIARGLTRVSDEALAHPRATQTAMAAFIASSLGIGATKLFPGLAGSIGLGKISGVLGNPAAKLIAAEQAAQVFDPTRGVGAPLGTITDPLWVVIAPLSRYVNEPEGTGSGVADTPSSLGKASRLGKFVRRLPGVGVAAAATYYGIKATDDFIDETPGAFSQVGKDVYSGARTIDKGIVKAAKWNPFDFGSDDRGSGRYGGLFGWNPLMKNAQRGQDFGEGFKPNIAALAGFFGGGGGVQATTARIPLKIELTGDAARVLKLVDPTKHVTTKVWPTGAPQSRGKPSSSRRGAG